MAGHGLQQALVPAQAASQNMHELRTGLLGLGGAGFGGSLYMELDRLGLGGPVAVFLPTTVS